MSKLIYFLLQINKKYFQSVFIFDIQWIFLKNLKLFNFLFYFLFHSMFHFKPLSFFSNFLIHFSEVLLAVQLDEIFDFSETQSSM